MYAREDGRAIRTLFVTLQHDQAVVMQDAARLDSFLRKCCPTRRVLEMLMNDRSRVEY